LNVALEAIKHRQQTVSVDGIYSIIGLLSYGNLFLTRYKEKDCLCDEVSKQNCNHYPVYTKRDLEENLYKLFSLAVQQGHGKEIMFSCTFFGLGKA